MLLNWKKLTNMLRLFKLNALIIFLFVLKITRIMNEVNKSETIVSCFDVLNIRLLMQSYIFLVH